MIKNLAHHEPQHPDALDGDRSCADAAKIVRRDAGRRLGPVRMPLVGAATSACAASSEILLSAQPHHRMDPTGPSGKTRQTPRLRQEGRANRSRDEGIQDSEALSRHLGRGVAPSGEPPDVRGDTARQPPPPTRAFLCTTRLDRQRGRARLAGADGAQTRTRPSAYLILGEAAFATRADLLPPALATGSTFFRPKPKPSAISDRLAA